MSPALHARRHAPFSLEGRTALVTGAGIVKAEMLGVGAAIAIALSAHGARVVACDLSAERANRTVAAIRADGGAAELFEGDLTDPEVCVEAAALAGRGRPVDVLVNNLGVTGGLGSVVDTDDDTWRTVLDVNLGTVVRMSRACLPLMKGGGSIVNVSSISAHRGSAAAAYSASKGAIEALTRHMALAHGRAGVRVNCITLGYLVTPISDLAQRGLRRQATMLGTEGDAWDAAWAALYLASDASRWVTGVSLPVDAGTTATTALPLHPFTSAWSG